jgi:hypothetical protein
MGALDPYSGQTLHLFDPDALVELFAIELIPWQVSVSRNPIAYWPGHINALGRP